MSTEEITNPIIQSPSLGQRLPFRLGRRRSLILAGFAAVGGGLALNWGWLTAVGVAPILITFLPCAAMCALGLCMRGGTNASCPTSIKRGVSLPAAGASHLDHRVTKTHSHPQ